VRYNGAHTAPAVGKKEHHSAQYGCYHRGLL